MASPTSATLTRMANFWDLPRGNRDKIYRLSLVQDKPITLKEHEGIVGYHISRYDQKYFLPPLLQVSKKAEKEAAPIYYGENHFNLGELYQFRNFASMTWPRHFKCVRKMTIQWSSRYGYGHYGSARENFIRMSKMKGLTDLTIQVDETDMLHSLSVPREVRQRQDRRSTDITQGQQLGILRLPGMAGLLAITNVKAVRFGKLVDENGAEYGGPIPGGALETYVLPRLRPKVKSNSRKRKGAFRFMDLPPELRNRVYDTLLRMPAPIHPSTEAPTSAQHDERNADIDETEHHESALSLLAVNKQMHDEAIGIFYNANSFVFYYPVQLNAFSLAVGPRRQNLLRDLTIHYHNLRLGGVDLVEITFPLLKQMQSLKKLHVLMTSPLHDTGLRSHFLQDPGLGRINFIIRGANPGRIPGIKTLFELRGVEDIVLRDLPLEDKVAEAKKDRSYPNLPADSNNGKLVQLARAYEHFNAALKDAQRGKVNAALLEDNDWHLNEEFPELMDENEHSEAGEAGEGEDHDGGNEEEHPSSDRLTEDSDFDFDA